jgi:acyl-CoA synthetase (NDP forming)
VSREIVKQLDPVFKPRSIAIIGASKNPNKWGGGALVQVLKGNYRGAIYPINPNNSEIMGFKAYGDVNEVNDEIDLAVFAVPAATMPKVMKSCIKKGIKGGVILSADFAETGEKGKALEQEIVRIANAGGLRFVGPNGMGIWTSAVGLNLAFESAPLAGSLAFVSQSGTFGGNLAQIAQIKGYGLSKFVSIGNQADINAAEYLQYFGQDEDTKVIAFYIEGFKDGRRFFEVAKDLTKIKPVLVYKGGTSEPGARATLSHTASIAGSDDIFNAMCQQAGIIRTTEMRHLFIIAEALIGLPLPRGNRVAVIGSGGQGVVTVDACAALELAVPELDEEAGIKMKEVLPPHAPVPSNPVDFAGGARTAVDEARIAAMLVELNYIDGIITNVPVTFTPSLNIGDTMKAWIDGTNILAGIPERYGKPVITQKFMGFENETICSILKNVGIPIYDGPEDSARAMYGLVRYAQIKNRQTA